MNKISKKNKKIIQEYNLLKESENIKKENRKLSKSKKQKDKIKLLKNQNRFKLINKKLYGYKNPYNKKRIRKTLNKEKKIKKSVRTLNKSDVIVYRYSVHYLFVGNGYEKEFRAEVYSDKKYSDNTIKTLLHNHIIQRIQHSNRGIQSMFRQAFLEGFESDRVGLNDIGYSKLNHVRVTFEDVQI